MLIWLASYPKSGNTWLRALLTAYADSGEATPDLDALLGAPIASDRHSLDDWSGVLSAELTQENIEELRSRYYRWRAQQTADDIFCKAHDAWHDTVAGVPLFSPDVTKAAIYLVRHPADVAISFAHHAGISVEAAVDRLCSPEAALDAMGRRHRRQLPQRLFTWASHVTSWVDAPVPQILVIRYEDMLSDARAALSQVVSTLGWSVEHDRIERAVAACAFHRLQRREQESGFREAPPGRGPFFRQGRAFGGRTLPRELWSRLVEVNGPVMRRFGYSVVQNDQEASAGE